jgi:SAM-dependent methyltransferase
MGADVVGIDIARNLVEAGNKRAAEAGLDRLKFQEGDACSLEGIADDSFDLTLSVFGAMFAPKPFDVAREMVRVTKPGGRIVMGNWIPNDPTSFVSQLLKISSSFTPPPPDGFVSPMTWGVESHIVERFGQAGVPREKISMVKDTFHFISPAIWPWRAPPPCHRWRERTHRPAARHIVNIHQIKIAALGEIQQVTVKQHNRNTGFPQGFSQFAVGPLLTGLQFGRREKNAADFSLDELFADFWRVFQAGVGVHAWVGGTAPQQAILIDARDAGNFAANDLKELCAGQPRHQQAQNTRGGIALNVLGTQVPEPARRSINPLASKSRNARATVGRETPNCLTNWSSLGRRAPAPYLPVAISISSRVLMLRCLDNGGSLRMAKSGCDRL